MLKRFSLLLALLLTLSACNATKDVVGTKAVANISALNGSTVSGVVIFEQLEDAVKITARFEGLNPNAKHGFHIHEFGDINDNSGKSAGGHYNPHGHDHSLPGTEHRHAGDLGNLQTDAGGRALYSYTSTELSISAGEIPVIGRSIIVHAKEDDGTGATGNAGKRIAAGVIGYKNTAK